MITRIHASDHTRRSIGRGEFVALMAAVMSLGALAIDAMLPALDEIAGSYGVTDPNRRQLVVEVVGHGQAVVAEVLHLAGEVPPAPRGDVGRGRALDAEPERGERGRHGAFSGGGTMGGGWTRHGPRCCTVDGLPAASSANT